LRYDTYDNRDTMGGIAFWFNGDCFIDLYYLLIYYEQN